MILKKHQSINVAEMIVEEFMVILKITQGQPASAMGVHRRIEQVRPIREAV